ncbi:MAG: hypothetical protein LBT05_08405 [Planctomycetaceae bacterium]|jgi:hypothetical protein|nr:hypothetical protein [Planctomycetaceae bacterium]
MIFGRVQSDFDVSILENHSSGVVRQFLKMYGQDVQREAKRRIKKGKANPTPADRSKPGEPPHSPTGTIKGKAFGIDFGVADDKKNVSVGYKQGKGGITQGAKALEYGGKTTLKFRGFNQPTSVKKTKVKSKVKKVKGKT